MGKIVYLMGKSSSGKDTIFKELMKEGTMDLRTIVPYTTRPIRADLIFPGSDAERAQALIACALYCLCYHRDGVQYHIFLRIIRIISGIHINFSIFQLIDLNLVRSNIVT